MLKTVPCVVLTSLKASTYSEYASAFRSLRPSNELVLSILPTSHIANWVALVSSMNSFLGAASQDCRAVSEAIQDCIKRDTNDAPPVESLWVERRG
jgi:hypothetical protein